MIGIHMGDVIQFPVVEKKILTIKFKDLHYKGVDYILLDIKSLRSTVDSLLEFNCPEAASCFQTMIEYLEEKGNDSSDV